MIAHRRLLPALAVITCGSMWGVFWIPVRWASDAGLGAAWLSLFLSAITVAGGLPWALRSSLRRGELKQFAITGLLMGSAFTLYSVSLTLTDVVLAILLFYLTPVWSTIGGFYFLGRPLGWRRVTALVLGLCGMAVVLGWKSGVPVPVTFGDWMALTSGVLWSAGSIRAVNQRGDFIALPVVMFGAGGGACAAVVAGIQHAQFQSSLNEIVPAFGLAAALFVVPTFLVLWAAQRLDPGRVGILLMGEVLVGAISAAMFSGEAITAGEMFGAALIVAAGFVEISSRDSRG